MDLLAALAYGLLVCAFVIGFICGRCCGATRAKGPAAYPTTFSAEVSRSNLHTDASEDEMRVPLVPVPLVPLRASVYPKGTVFHTKACRYVRSKGRALEYRICHECQAMMHVK